MDREVAAGSPLRTAPESAGTAFAVWAAAFAVGVLIHEWQAGQPPLSAGVVVVVAAVLLVLRPSSVPRLVLLSLALGVELVTWMPDPWNHLLLVGVVGVGFVLWWLGVAARSWSDATDPAQMYVRVGPYLRTAFILSWFFAAFAKLNTGFLDATSTCAVWILEGIPLVQVPLMLSPTVAVGTVLLELSIPLLLLFHRTRPTAVVLGFTFHVISALAGHAAFGGLAWSFYLLFLPPAVLAGVADALRRALPAWLPSARLTAVGERMVVAAVGVSWFGAVAAVALLPDGLEPSARRWGASLVCLAWFAGWAWALVRVRGDWLHPSGPGPRQGLAVRNGVLLVALGLLALTAAMPYVGLKTRAAFTMYSNLRTDAGHWNHLVVPEAARVFDWQDRTVELVDTDDPALAARIDRVRRVGGDRLVLTDARGLLAEFPDASLEYLLDGAPRRAARVADDAVLGEPLSTAQRWLGGFRPLSDVDSCLH